MTDPVLLSARKRAGRGFGWRQINLRARDAMNVGTPHLQLHESFMLPECLELQRLEQSEPTH